MATARAKAFCLLSLFTFPACSAPYSAGTATAQRPAATSGADIYESALVAPSWLELAPFVLALAPERAAESERAALLEGMMNLAPASATATSQASTPAQTSLAAFTTQAAESLERDESDAGTEVVLFNANTHESLVLAVSREGKVSADAESAVEAFFKCRRSGRAHAIEPGVLRVVASIAREYPQRVIEVISGFRTQPYGVKDSKHFAGRAIDLRVRGVKLTKVRDFVWRNFGDVGVGYYGPQNFIHVDYRPGRKDTAWSSAHENAAYEFNPRWALRIRAPWQHPAGTAETGAPAEASRELAHAALPAAL